MENVVQSFYTWYRATLRNSKYRWLIIAGTLAYLISPIDIAPDFIPIIGWIDDAAIATLLVTELSQVILEYVNARKGNAQSSMSEPTEVDVVSVEVD